MKRRYLSLVCVIAFMVSVFGANVRASEAGQMIDGSYLTLEDESTGEAVLITRGEDLQSGTSKVSKAAAGVINAGGTTTADHTVAEIGVAVIVERCKSGATSWSYYKSWEATKYNTSYVSSSKRLAVPSGYYYRVRCTHWANSDASSSSTNGVYIN